MIDDDDDDVCVFVCRSSEEDSRHAEVNRQLVELEREISLTSPVITELDGRLTGYRHHDSSPTSPDVHSPTTSHSSTAALRTTPADTGSVPTAADKTASPTGQTASAAVTTTHAQSGSITALDKPAAAADNQLQVERTVVDSGLQLESPVSSSQTLQVCCFDTTHA